MRFDQVASSIVSANHRIMCDVVCSNWESLFAGSRGSVRLVKQHLTYSGVELYLHHLVFDLDITPKAGICSREHKKRIFWHLRPRLRHKFARES
jgi:hypothetical protein